ncbi:MAG: hypothetical protein ACETVN_01530 [Asgard group archaeon]
MGKVKKGVTCSIAGCEKEAVKSLSLKRISKSLNNAGLKLKDYKKKRRVYLCDTHYKTVKKDLRSEAKIEKMRYGPLG